MTGTIKTLLKDRKCGFIRGEDRRDYFFHQTGLKNVGFNELKEGDELTFEDTESEKGLRAEDVYV